MDRDRQPELRGRFVNRVVVPLPHQDVREWEQHDHEAQVSSAAPDFLHGKRGVLSAHDESATISVVGG